MKRFALGAEDPLAKSAVQVLMQNNIPIKTSGQTRFGEPISDGIIGPVTDSSVDELISASQIVVEGEVRTGPGAHTVLVFETPAGNIALQTRIAAHAALLHDIARSLGS